MNGEPTNASAGDEPDESGAASGSSQQPADDWPPEATTADRSARPGRARGDRTPPPRPPEEVTARVTEQGASNRGSAAETKAKPDKGDVVVGTVAAEDTDGVAGVITEGDPQVGVDLLPDHSFALCLTHDVDRPYRIAQAVFYAFRDRDPGQLRALLPGHHPNWTFDRMLAIEADLGVRSAFYFLDEQRLLRDRPWHDLLDPDAWRLYADRYAVDDPPIVELIHRLDDGGWEVGLHGSYESYDDRERLRREKRRLEAVLGRQVRGGRQHYLNRTLPETWEHHAALGLEYDATLGSSSEVGFQYGDTVARPFEDSFVTFPLTMMDVAVPDPGADPDAARAVCDRVLREAADRGAVVTVLWHPRTFNGDDWPGHADIYRHLIERAQELGAWVGSPGALYDRLDHPD